MEMSKTRYSMCELKNNTQNEWQVREQSKEHRVLLKKYLILFFKLEMKSSSFSIILVKS